MNRIFFCLALILPFLVTQKSISGVDPKIQWETLNTPHFEVLYDARHYQTARKYALRLELNHKLLGAYFKESPDKTVVILNDNTDLANGYATRIPYPHIMAYPVLPSSHDSISEYSDWPQELTLHEYTHILNFEPVHGVMRFLRYTLGSIITPTMLLPRWWHEGIAVEMETRYSSHGRLRSTYQDATLRAMAKENQFSMYSVADINEAELESWPRGARPYLFGSLLLSEIQSQKGGTIGDTLLQRYSRRIPYLINGPAEDEAGKDFEGLFNDAIKTVESKAQKQLEQIRQLPTTNFTPLSKKYLESHSPQLSPNGRFLTLVAKNIWGKSSIQIFDRHDDGRNFDFNNDSFSEFLSIDNKDGGGSKDAPPAGNINRVAWLHDSSGFVFDQVRFIDVYANYSDLFIYELDKKKNRRLTTGMRLREPGLSPSGLLIAAVQMMQSSTMLSTLNTDGSNLEQVYIPPAFHKIAAPLFIDEQTIVFTERDLQGMIALKKINLSTKQIEKINLPNLSQIDSLNQEASGISFIARENGMQNFYFTQDQFKSYQRLTHTETAVFDGTIDSRVGAIYNTIMSNNGLLVTSAELPHEPLKEPMPTIEPLLNDRYGQTKLETPSDEALEKDFGSMVGEKKTYSPLKYMLPTYWLPFAYVTESGYGTQISTATFDPLGKHAYSIQAGYDSFAHESSVGINYGNATTYWPYSLTAAAQERDQPYLHSHYDAQQLNFLTTHDLRPLSEYMTVGLGVDSNIITTTTSKKRIGPQVFFVYDGAAKSLFSEVPFAGYQFQLMGNHYVKTAQLSSLSKGFVSGTYFHSKFLPERHIALIHLQSQIMKGEIEVSDLSQSDTFHLTQNFTSPRFVLRGYDQGYFYFKSAHSAAMEYHLPLKSYKGWGTFPLFIRHSRMSVYAEALAIDGISLDYNSEEYVRTYLKKSFSSYGIEFKGDLTLGYFFPVTCMLGIYHRPQYSGPDKTSTFIGFQI